jgi:hypothetical protein
LILATKLPSLGGTSGRKMPINNHLSEDVYKTYARRVEYRDGELYWIKPHLFAGKIVGNFKTPGEARRITNGPSVHRLIYYIHHGWVPRIIDHKDGNTRNNRIENLRAATEEQNQANSKRAKNNTSGFKGVSYHKPTGKWTSSIRLHNKAKYLGKFDTAEEAHAAYCAAGERLRGEYFNAGK